MISLPRTIKMVITDFDGVITDNCVYIDSKGEMSRKLNFKDIMAFSLLRKNDFKRLFEEISVVKKGNDE